MADNALFKLARQPQVKQRGTILPIAEYDDGSYGMAWPEMVHAPAMAFKRAVDSGMPASVNDPDGAEAAYRDMGEVALGTMLGGSVASMGSGAARGAVGSAGGKIVQPQGLKAQLESQLAALQHALDSGNVPKPDDTIPAMRNAAGTMPETAGSNTFYRGVTRPDQPLAPVDEPTWWASSSPRVASEYAGHDGAAVFPSEARFQNPLEVDARGANFIDIPFEGERRVSDWIANEARARGHDGVIFRNLVDAPSMGAPSDVIAAVKRGTIYSPMTGEQLFANAKSGAALPLTADGGEQQDIEPALMAYLKQIGLY